MKILGGGLVVVACGGFGAYPVRKMNCRISEMEILYYCILRLKSEICHTMDPLPEALLGAAGSAVKKGSVYGTALAVLAEKLRNGKEGYETHLANTMDEVFSGSVITTEETESFRRVFVSLGGADKERQAGILTHYAEQIQEELRGEKKKKKERAYLYRSMGILCGIFLTVLLL